MTHRLSFICLLLAALLTTTANAAPLNARLTLKNKQKWDAELKGRHGDLVTLIESGKTTEVSLPITEITSIEFRLDLEKTGAIEKFDANNFKAAAAALQAVLPPTFPYLDAKNNVLPYVSLLLRALYWSEQYRETLSTAETLLARLPDDSFKRELQLWRILALLESGRKTDAEIELERMGPVPRKDDLAAMYFYARSTIQWANQQWEPAHITATQLVVFRPKDLEWLPAGLYLTARGYGQMRAYDTANQILDELQRFFPQSRWVPLIPKLQEAWKQQREADEKARAEKEKEEAKYRIQPARKDTTP